MSVQGGCWTEVGAEVVATIQSLLLSFRQHALDPYDYVVAVLHRIGTHPANEVHQIIPQLWEQHFTDNPLHSDLHDLNR